MKDRRQNIDEAKFSTQKAVTYMLLGIFAAVTTNVLLGTDQAERSTILQTVINLTILGVGYWLGSSKGATDSNTAIGNIAQASAPATAAAVAATVAAAAATPGAAPIPVVPVVPQPTEKTP